MKLLHFVADEKVTKNVVEFTHEFARLTNASLTMLYIASSEDKRRSANEMWEGILSDDSDQKFETKFADGDPIERLLTELEKNNYDMIVVGASRRRGLVPSRRRKLLNRILQVSPVPVLLVRKNNLTLENMLICTGGQKISEPVVRLSASVATETNVKATLLYVTNSVPSMYTGMNGMEESLEDLLETDTPLANHLRSSAELLSENNVEAQITLRHGVVSEAILRELETGDYDLIVMGASGMKSNLAGWFLGDVTQEIIHRASSAVLVVK